ncbi:unnamed protein product [Enterobius vermicularis]|uniref:Peptidase_M13 domain-containing protein n=1 Tax=Enterobius vermicularis TaxID=51028 RepID=A0A0N4V872_ENTVE|nr:unnamed protein product [Enterobius vermicularis]
MTHAFDQIGKNFGEHGEIRDWWSKQTSAMFDSRLSCFTKLFSNKGIKLNVTNNDEMIVNEAVADHGGLKLAFQAYKESNGNDSEESSVLPGLEKYDPDQTFFLAAGYTLCGHDASEALAVRRFSDPHPISSLRLNVLMSNNPNFNKAFKCYQKHVLNNELKCAVW